MAKVKNYNLKLFLLFFIFLAAVGIFIYFHFYAQYFFVDNRQREQQTQLAQLHATVARKVFQNREINSKKVLVKFNDGLSIRLRGGKLLSIAGEDTVNLQKTLKDFEVSQIERVFREPEAELENWKMQAEENSNTKMGDLNLWFRLWVPKEKAGELVSELKQLSQVEMTFVEALTTPTPTPN